MRLIEKDTFKLHPYWPKFKSSLSGVVILILRVNIIQDLRWTRWDVLDEIGRDKK